MTEPVQRRRGRPRDPEIEPRVFAAALALYAERGWSGFSLEAVARRAGVGLAALYRRWASKAELLGDAIRDGAPDLPPVDTGTSRGDLIALTEHFLASYRDPLGVVGMRMVLDIRTAPELAAQLDAMLAGDRPAAARAVAERAAGRGDLRPGTSPGLALEIITGTTLGHVLFRPGDPATAARDARFVGALVDALLADPAPP